MPVRPIVWDSGSFIEKISDASETLEINNIDPSGSANLKIGDSSQSAISIGNNLVVTYVSGVLSSSDFVGDDVKFQTLTSSFISGTFYGSGQNLSGILQNYDLHRSSSLVFSTNSTTGIDTLVFSSSIQSEGNYYINWYSEYSNTSTNSVTALEVSLITGSLESVLGEVSYKINQSGLWSSYSGFSINYLKKGNYVTKFHISASGGTAQSKNHKLVLWKLA